MQALQHIITIITIVPRWLSVYGRPKITGFLALYFCSNSVRFKLGTRSIVQRERFTSGSATRCLVAVFHDDGKRNGRA